MTDSRIIVGSETQGHAEHTGIIGLTRVTRESHAVLDNLLSPLGIEIVPVRTRPSSEPEGSHWHPYLANDPVMARPLTSVENLDALLILGLTMTTDFGRIVRVKRKRRLPTISVVHDVIPLHHPEWFPPKAREHFRAYLQQLLHISDHVVVTSETVKRALLNLGWRIPGEISLMRMGSSFSQQPPTSAPPAPLGLLYVSTVAPYKGHRFLLDVFDRLQQLEIDVELTIVGRQGWMADDIADAIFTHQAFGSRVHWKQNATDHDIVDIASRCHVAVVPSEDEGFGIFLEEGLTLGLAAVARDIPVFRERPYPNLSFSAGTAEAMTEAILQAHKSPPRALARGEIRSMEEFASELATLVVQVTS